MELLREVFQLHATPGSKEDEVMTVPTAEADIHFSELPIASGDHELFHCTMHLRLAVNVNTTALPLALTPIEVRANECFTGRAVITKVWGVQKGREYATSNSIVDFKVGIGCVFLLNAFEKPLSSSEASG